MAPSFGGVPIEPILDGEAAAAVFNLLHQLLHLSHNTIETLKLAATQMKSGLDGGKTAVDALNSSDMSTVSGLGNVGGLERILTNLGKPSLSANKVERLLDELSD